MFPSAQSGSLTPPVPSYIRFSDDILPRQVDAKPFQARHESIFRTIQYRFLDNPRLFNRYKRYHGASNILS